MSSPSSSSPALPTLCATTAKPIAQRSRGFARRAVLSALGDLDRGGLELHLPEGETRRFGAAEAAASAAGPAEIPASAQIRLRNEAFFRKCFWSGDVGFAESYIDGDWETDDLAAVVAFFIRNLDRAPTLSGSSRPRSGALNLLRFANRLRHILRPNTPRIARRNIREHYDLSNAFFALWLDPSLMYSAAKWPAHAPHLSLADAQREKNDALCTRLRLQPGDHVLEIGTGWGGWALHAAHNYGCRITTVTISREQYDLARRRVHEAGLDDRVEVQLRDFRDISGGFDKIVSIEMLEAIGHRYQPAFAEVVARVLKPEGLLALQFITCPDSRYTELRRGVDFIQKHIFPGSLLLSVNRLNGLLARAGGFVLHELDDFGPDYARTLRLWHQRFRAALPQVRALGFDERFIRKWSYYLGYCEAAFALRNISVVHTVHTRPNNLNLK